MDLKVPVFRNKNNGQISIALPKKELGDFMDIKDRKFLPIRIWRKK